VDVGTNSVKLLVAAVQGDVVTPLVERSQQTRLGRGLYQTHQLQPAAIAETALAIERFVAEARALGAGPLHLLATSAAREARNAADLLAAVRAATGLEVEVIPGEREAELAFAGVMTDARLHDRTVLLMDVGGGSSEFILGDARGVFYRHSHRLGVLRLWETLQVPEAPTPADLAHGQALVMTFLDEYVAPGLGPALANHAAGKVQIVGTGGTASILGAMTLGLVKFDRDALDGAVLTRCQVAEWLERLWALRLDARRRLPGLPPERADVILPGVLIYDSVMGRFGFDSLRVTTRGLRYAALAGA
jgi:exopolyphosphatase/guanosine-5'-triphosphate,3'-diphosphate pyrophosphatase